MGTHGTTANAATPGSRRTARRTGRLACPFCALLCDDLGLTPAADGTPLLDDVGCPRATAGFARRLPPGGPRIAGREASLADAVDAAAAILRRAKMPLYGGLATDVDGMRGLLALADATGGVLDHALSRGAFANIAVLQSRGWVMSTLTEVRNRADLVIVVGDGIGAAFPRLYTRVLRPSETLFRLRRRLVMLGTGEDRALVAPGTACETVPCPPSRIATAIGALRAALAGRVVPPVAGLAPETIVRLAADIRAARYPVFVWAAGLLPAADADLTVLSIADLVRDLNTTQRSAGLALGGSEGGATAQAVTAWQTGYPLRVALATGIPVYDPTRFDIARMLAAGDGDALVWTAAISADVTPPPTAIPTIVLGTPGLALEAAPAVLIPVGTPGLDHPGDLVRTDGVVTLRLGSMRDLGLPRVADVAAAIAARVGG